MGSHQVLQGNSSIESRARDIAGEGPAAGGNTPASAQPITGGITMELVKDFCYVVKEGIVCVEVFSITENRWKYVTVNYFEKHCKLMK